MLISSAFAATGTPAADWTSFVPFIVIFILFFFMIIRPQMKQAKEHKTMIDALQKGDEVITSGGIVGKVVKVSDGFVSIEIATEVTINVQRPSIQTILPKGTVKSL